MLKLNVQMIVLSVLLAANAVPHAEAKTISSEKVCRFDKMVLCSAVADSDDEPCEAENSPFTIVAVGVGAGGMAFQIDNAAGDTGSARGRNNMNGTGMHFKHADAAYALDWNDDKPIALIVRSSKGKALSAEAWAGSCTVQDIDIDMIEKGAMDAQ